jgi:hypothetical protein
MDFMIVRDQRTGGPYTDEAAKADMAKYGWFANEAADIEVEIRLGGSDFYKGSGEPDDPDSADVSGGARVYKDIPKICWITKAEIPGEFVFRAGQIIELTSDELSEAEEQALDEAREAAEPEYSPR